MASAWTQREEPPATRGDLILVEGSSFALSDGNGDMRPDRPLGVFVRDTRIVSGWRLLIDDQPIQPLSAAAAEPYAGVFLGRSQPGGDSGTRLVVDRRRYVGDGLREDITLSNYDHDPRRVLVVLEVDSDFADLFAVKAGRVDDDGRPRAAGVRHEVLAGQLVYLVGQGEGTRGVRVASSGAVASPGRLSWQVVVPAKGRWSTTVEVVARVDGHELAPSFPAGLPVAESGTARQLADRRRVRPAIHTDWPALSQALAQSEEDLDVLRIADPESPEIDVVAAGAPWFMTLFGRDALLAGWMMLPLRSDLALGSLQTLARLQGIKVDPAKEEQPGRIPHELRRGLDLDAEGAGGFKVYYGTIDATPLFVMLLGEMRRWGHAHDEVEALLPAADRALEWIDRYGDRDRDGFVEYLRATDAGLRNQGWKDHFDSMNFVDGTLAEPPIALAEVQGYVYAAYRARAHFAEEAGDVEACERWSDRAEKLRRDFNERFWLPERGWFAVGLDRDKRPIDALTSNIGHCLWTGIVDEDKAQAVADALMSDDMFTGFGIRTLAASMGAYNPVSYHNGSVWPHDNAIIATGLMRYGFVEASQRVARGILDAAVAFGGRLPELFCGFDRRDYAAPVPYPASCSPQAWSAAAPVQILRTLLRLDPDLPRDRVWLAPVLPAGVGVLGIDGLAVGEAKVTVEVTGSSVTVGGLPAGVTLVSSARPLHDRPATTGPATTGPATTGPATTGPASAHRH
jgi:glycogen debranching enzyme